MSTRPKRKTNNFMKCPTCSNQMTERKSFNPRWWKSQYECGCGAVLGISMDSQRHLRWKNHPEKKRSK